MPMRDSFYNAIVALIPRDPVFARKMWVAMQDVPDDWKAGDPKALKSVQRVIEEFSEHLLKIEQELLEIEELRRIQEMNSVTPEDEAAQKEAVAAYRRACGLDGAE
jgi:hypothetical protein